MDPKLSTRHTYESIGQTFRQTINLLMRSPDVVRTTSFADLIVHLVDGIELCAKAADEVKELPRD